MKVYANEYGNEFKFNDHICVEMLMGVPDEKRTGRLVQVRKGCGQFGSCTYIIRLRDGSLASFENVMIRHANDARFENAYYRSNGKEPPIIRPQPPHESDSENVEYTIAGKYPETGFIIESPAQPQREGAFAVTITTPPKGKDDEANT
jgi:hypothetical protein